MENYYNDFIYFFGIVLQSLSNLINWLFNNNPIGIIILFMFFFGIVLFIIDTIISYKERL